MTTPPLNILDHDVGAAQHDGESHALALDITLVTNNMREFERVPGAALGELGLKRERPRAKVTTPR